MRRLIPVLVLLALFFRPRRQRHTPRAVSVTVKVLNPDGSPAEGAEVALQNGNYAVLASATTDISGTCNFNVSPGSAAVRALVNGGDVVSVWHEAGNATIEVRLRRVGEVPGPSAWTAWAPAIRWSCWITTRFTTRRPTTCPGRTARESTCSPQTGSLSPPRGPTRSTPSGYSNGTVYRSEDVAINLSEASPPVVLELRPYSDNASVLPSKVYDRIFHTSAGGAHSASRAGSSTRTASP